MTQQIVSDTIIYGQLEVEGSAIISGTLQIHDGVALSDGVNLDQLNSAISGTLPYWESHLIASADTSPSVGTSGVNFFQQASDTVAQSVMVARNSKIIKWAMNAAHLHGSDPGDWDVQVFKSNDFDNPVLTFQFPWNANSATQELSVGTPTVASGIDIWSGGESYSIVASGPGVLDLLSLKLTIGWEGV